MNDPLFLNLSIDCERLHGETCCMGPKSELESLNNILSFVKLCNSLGFCPDLYITPSAAKLHASELGELIAQKLIYAGLHLHVPSFRKYKNFQKIELANLDKETQHQFIKEAIEDFKDALGFKPSFFRAGMGSANQSTFEALTELGLFRGSCTIPPQKSEKYNFDWSKFPTVPHYIKTEHGDFLNLPLTNNLWIGNKENRRLTELSHNSYLNREISIYTHNWVDFSPESHAAYQLTNTIKKLSKLSPVNYFSITNLSIVKSPHS